LKIWVTKIAISFSIQFRRRRFESMTARVASTSCVGSCDMRSYWFLMDLLSQQWLVITVLVCWQHAKETLLDMFAEKDW